jgi:hypothetical protein
MMSKCTERFCKDCLDKIPEKDRTTFVQNLKKICPCVSPVKENNSK